MENNEETNLAYQAVSPKELSDLGLHVLNTLAVNATSLPSCPEQQAE